MSIFDFFTREAGQERRRALEGLLTQFIPPEMRPQLGLLAEANPVVSMERAGQDAQTLFAPDQSLMDRLAAGGRMASNMAGVVAPAIVAGRVGMPVANAVTETLTGYSPMVQPFLVDEFGGLTLRPGETLGDALQAKYPDVKLSVTGNPERGYTLGQIVVPKDQRGAGVGTAVMRDLLETADEQGAKVALTPSGDFGGSASRLREFYKRFGFVPNKGRNADYSISESMYRLPQDVPPTPLPASAPAGAYDPIASRGAQIMNMLRSGRAADVTDEMLDMGDPVANARLNEWLFNNYDLPMDAASRAARAGDMGMDTAAYHATKADFQAFRPGWRGSNYFAQTAEDATRGATFGALDNASPTSGTGGAVTDRVMSVMMPGDEVARLRPSRSAWDALPAEITPAQAKSMAEDAKRATGASYLSDIYEEVEVRPPQWDARDNLIDPGEYRLVKKPFPAAQYGDLNGRDGMGYMLPGFNSGTDVAALEALSRNTGQKGFLVNDEAGTTIVAGPDMPIRSRFARFDPRLAHLKNLNAALAAGVPLGLLAMQPQGEQY